jgi:hypothetical protein
MGNSVAVPQVGLELSDHGQGLQEQVAERPVDSFGDASGNGSVAGSAIHLGGPV